MATDFLGRKRGIAYVMVHTHSSDSRYILNARSMITKMYHIDLFFSGSLCDLLEMKKNVYISVSRFLGLCRIYEDDLNSSHKSMYPKKKFFFL